jgi:hypothetical protein
VDRKAFSLGVLEALGDALKRRDIYVYPSERYADPRAKSGKPPVPTYSARWSYRPRRRSTCRNSASISMRPTGVPPTTSPTTPM